MLEAMALFGNVKTVPSPILETLFFQIKHFHFLKKCGFEWINICLQLLLFQEDTLRYNEIYYDRIIFKCKLDSIFVEFWYPNKL